MLKRLLFFNLLFAIPILFFGCSNSLDNSITLNNTLSNSNIIFNFRGTITQVPIGKTVVISNILGGTYNYATTYDYPSGATTVNASGATNGSLSISGGTKILFLYTDTYANNVYTLYVTMTSSDNQSSPTTP